MVLEKEIIFQEYPVEYSHQNGNEVIYENSDTGERISYDGIRYTFAGTLPEPNNHKDYEFEINGDQLFENKEFSWIEYNHSDRIKILILEESLEELRKATNPI
ncbi:hypothetical protein CMI43_00805 [Candidatus Pacearchaeota archaeon]|jgi:hypothetical protein|nr:hypothetical protein [Candidatus Pacearchaeota archaeon]|tara:strand:- start:2071 stop:2379 length:309 start_codon:yes stop_codon:yes gene_type:complete